MKKIALALLVALPFLSSAQNMPELVRDFGNISRGGSFPNSFVRLKDTAYFLVLDNGVFKMWQTDGRPDTPARITRHTLPVPLTLNQNERIEGNLVGNGRIIYFFTIEEATSPPVIRLYGFDGQTKFLNTTLDSRIISLDDVQLIGDDPDYTIWYQTRHDGNDTIFRNRYDIRGPASWLFEEEEPISGKQEFLGKGSGFFVTRAQRPSINAARVSFGNSEFGFTDICFRGGQDMTGGRASANLSGIGLGILNRELYYTAFISRADTSFLFAASRPPNSLIMTIIPIASGIKAASSGITLKNKLYFLSTDSSIWRTDGTGRGTINLKQKATDLDTAANRFFFLQKDKRTVFELKNDTAKQVTPLSITIGSLPDGEKVESFIALNNKAYLVTARKMLYRIDSAALVLIGLVQGFNGQYTAVNDSTMVFSGFRADVGQELFRLSLKEAPPSVDLAISLSSSVAVFKKYTHISYKLTVQNIGSQTAKDIVVTFPFPQYTVTGGLANPSVGIWSEWCKGDTQCFQWTFPVLAPHESATLDVPLFILYTQTPIVATAKIIALSPADNNTTNNEARLTLNPEVAAMPSSRAFHATQQQPVVIQGLSPVPTDDRLTIQLESLKEQEARFSISDATGRSLQEENRRLEKGRQNVSIEVFNLPSGIYFLQVSSNRLRNLPIKFVKL